jgi:hypothetical protein
MSQPPNVTETSHLQKSPIMKVNVSKKRKINAVPVVKKKKEKEYGCKNHCPRKDVKESPQMDLTLVNVSLTDLAWKDRYGQVLPKFYPSAKNY